MKHLKTFNESEVSSGNASGKAGVGSLAPFGTGFYKSGNNGEFGTQFTPSAEPTFKTYKSMKHSKKNLKKKKTKNSILVENISNLNLGSIKDTDIIKLVYDYGFGLFQLYIDKAVAPMFLTITTFDFELQKQHEYEFGYKCLPYLIV